MENIIPVIFITIIFGTLTIFILMLFDLLITDGKTITFVSDCISKTKMAKNHKMNESYKSYLSNLKYQGDKLGNSIVELPLSVIIPLLHNDSPIVYASNKDVLTLRKDKYDFSFFYVKLSKKDYKEYYKYLTQKKENDKHIEQTEATLKVTKLIQAELNRINEEALKSIEVEKEKINHLTSNLSNNGLNNIAEVYKHIASNDTYYYTDSYGRRFWKDEAGNQYMSVTDIR